jgi:aerobic carbon-monoxide dehydrogenase small subunit
MPVRVELTVNGARVTMEAGDDELLGDLLRDRLGLRSVRYGCHEGVCGSCTVLVDGQPARACLLIAAQADGAAVQTVEGMGDETSLHPIQEAFVEHGALQCGYCTSGFLMATRALLAENPAPSEAEIREGLAGNLCRCTGYSKIVEAVSAAARELAERPG